MDGAMDGGLHYALGPRIPVMVDRDVNKATTPTLGSRIPSRIWSRSAAATTSDSKCAPGSNTNPQLCEKPASSSGMAIPIALGIALPLAAIIITLLVLHRRHNQKLRKEDATDPHKELDFGLDDTPATGKGGKRRSMMMLGGGKEKDHGARFKQMSMDLNLSSPYLLPPGMHGSRESIQSLAKSIDPHHDPYRPVAQLAADNASLRSPSRGPPESLYGVSSHEKDIGRSRSPIGAVSRQNSLPKPPVPTAEQTRMGAQPVLPELSIPAPAKDPFRSPSEMSRQSIDSAHFPDEKDFVAMPAAPEISEPAPATQRNMDRPMPEKQPVRSDSGSSSGVVHHGYNEERHRSQQAVIHERGPSVTNNGPISPPPQQALPVSPQPQRPAEHAATAPVLEEPQEYYDYDNYAQMPEVDHEQRGRGRSTYRDTVTSVYDEEPHPAQGGLGVPQQDGRRLSVGFRPLPPDELIDNEDPETRANRIRSFYKEYFDDSGPKPDVPEVPQQYFAAQQQQRSQQQANQGLGSVNYYEDYNQNYSGHGAEEPYYDPDTNSFVMPYAQPVARRAMTPPPSGSRFNGPRGPPGPPRGMHGSMGGGMGMPGPRGPGYGPRPGSGASSRYGPPRPGSAMSQGTWGNRPRGSTLSALSGARNGPPKKQLPPPADLNTLPTPSKLKDDSFAIFNAADFAPPESFKDRARGRSQSPMGERRPYQVTVPAHSPLVNAFEELPSIPSPHLLSKEGTFTNLEFAAPRKFVDSDTRSDAGSIRSNRSGISAIQQQALRSGAGRVSRLPGDTIFNQAEMAQKLKPQWTMRP